MKIVKEKIKLEEGKEYLGYSLTGSKVFFKGAHVDDTNPEFFYIDNNGCATDYKNDYFQGQKVQMWKLTKRGVRMFLENECYIYFYPDNHSVDIDDSAHINVLNEYFLTTSQTVYYYVNGSMLPLNTDVKSFRIISAGKYAFNDTYVFYGNRIIDGADPKSFFLLEGEYASDSKSIFFEDKKVLSREIKIFFYKKINDYTFDVYWGCDRYRVYYDGKEIKGADPATFNVLKQSYYHDKHRVYYERKCIVGVDKKTFIVLEDGCYAKDKKAAYYCGEKIHNAKQNSFALYVRGRHNLTDGTEWIQYYARDTNSVFDDRGNKIASADVSSFQVLGNDYAKDTNYVYYYFKIIDGADPDTFQVIQNGWYGKDKRHVYEQGVIVDDAIPEHFQVIENYYGREGGRIRYYPQWYENIHAPSFQPIHHEFLKGSDFTYARDKERVYVIQYKNISEISGADPKSFQIINENYCKDKNFVYLQGEKISHADPDSFTCVEGYFSKDKNHVYRDGTILSGANPATFFTYDWIEDIPEVKELIEETRIALYLNPKRAQQAIVSSTSKMGGQPETRGFSAWPICDACQKSLHFVLQIFKKEYPQFYFPEHANVFLLFRCANNECKEYYTDLYRWDTKLFWFYQNESTYKNKEIAAQPNVVGVFDEEVKECFFEPFERKEYSNDDCHSDTQHQFENNYPKYIVDMFWDKYGVIGGTKIGGYPTWVQATTDPMQCSCGNRKEYFFQLSAREPNESVSFTPKEKFKYSDHDLLLVDVGVIYFFVCKNCGFHTIETCIEF